MPSSPSRTSIHRRPSGSPAVALLRPAADRFHTRLDWLASHHTFSFGSHHDPAWMGFGPLRVINDDTIAPGRGFGLHPHRDMEIITVMVEGDLEHRDSLGHGALLRAGEVQWMSAGTGILHSEMNSGSQPCRLLQIWIEPERSGQEPAYGQRPFAISSAWTPLIDPQGRDGTLAIRRAVRLWRARPEADTTLPLPLPEGQAGWLQIISGSVRLQGSVGPIAGSPPGPEPDCGDLRLDRGDGLALLPQPGARPETLKAGADGADLLLFALR